MDPSEYLQPDFDPAKYKVAQLRNVLLQNDVEYPNSAKKKDLIDLFNKHIKPQAAGKLLELENVVANDVGIEIVSKSKKSTEDKLLVEKKKKGGKDATPEPSEGRSRSPVRKSPRKVSKSKADPVAPDADHGQRGERNSTHHIGKIPDLTQESSRVRERSPERKASKEGREPETRQRSPRRKAKDQDDVAKDKSPKKISNGIKKVVANIPKPEANVHEVSSSDGDDSDDSNGAIEVVSKQEFEQDLRSPFKVGSKAETSFTNENVFQSPSESPEFKVKKSIPRKRNIDASSKSPKKSAKRKTAFSSSPEPVEVKPKSPKKKALEISKFESSSPPLHKLSNKPDIFDISDSKLSGFEKELETSNTKHAEPEAYTTGTETFNTPNDGDGNASRLTIYSSNAGTPNKDTPSKRKSLLPDFSKFKVSRDFAKTLGFSTDTKAKKEKDPELLPDETENEPNHDDSDLLNLESQIEDAKRYILDEAEEAVKQINEIFNEDEKKNEDKDKEVELDDFEEDEIVKEPFDWSPILAFFKQTFSFIFFVAIVISALWYREQRVLVGYCGNEINQPTFGNTDNDYLIKIEDFLQDLKPACVECPENAICLPNLKIKCKQDYIVREPWYKLYGVLPVSDYCVKDQEKENIISEVLSKTLELLRTRNANTKCGDGDDLEVGISDDELYQFFFHSKKSTISDEGFDEIWVKVLQDLAKEPEITLRYINDDTGPSKGNLSTDEDEEETNISTKKVVFRSNSSIKLSISCKFKKEIYERFKANKLVIIVSSVVLFAVLFAYYQLVKYQKRESKIKELGDIIITKLQKQVKNANSDSTGLTSSYLRAIQLRDELLANYKLTVRLALWDSILNRLNKNANIRIKTQEINGEIFKIIEWIGEI